MEVASNTVVKKYVLFSFKRLLFLNIKTKTRDIIQVENVLA